MTINNKLIDLRYLNWSKARDSSGTAGSYLKSYSYKNGKKIYYKLSYFDEFLGAFGYESFNEIIAGRLMDLLNIPHLNYELIHASICINGKEYETYLNSSYDFKGKNESKITFELFYEINDDYDNKLEFAEAIGVINEIYQMFIIDYLIMNRDRHGANIEILYNEKYDLYRFAPLFDQGLSLLSPAYKDDDIDKFDITINRKTDNYIGCVYSEDNLDLIPKDFIKIPKLDLDYVFGDLEDIMNKAYLKKAKQIIEKRWKHLEDIFNKK